MDNEIINLLLKLTKKNEQSNQRQTLKTPITIEMLLNLVRFQHNKSEIHNTLISLALCAFWGVAQLGEFIRDSYEVGALTIKDVRFGTNESGHYTRFF